VERYVLLILLLLVIVISGCTGMKNIESNNIPRYFKNISLSITGTPALNQTVNLTLTAETTSIGWGSNISLKILLPDGFELNIGNLTWEGFIGQNETANLSVTIKANQTGNWMIQGIGGPPPTGEQDRSVIYVSVEENGGSVSYEPSQPCSGSMAEVTECMKAKTVRG